MNLSPQFGGSSTEEQREMYRKTGHYEDDIFINDEIIEMEVSFSTIMEMIDGFLNPDPNMSPTDNIEVVKLEEFEKVDSVVSITWLGHSSFFIEFEGKKILLDPVFGDYAAPHSLLGKKRFNAEMPIEIIDLPEIDAIIISHDHYDHLDYPSIKELKDKTKHFFVPLGVDNHLKEWGVKDEDIDVFDWWDESSLEGIKIAFAPSRHMSGRGLTDQSATLWGSWVLKGGYKSLYFSGDGGYGKHFKEIGEKYGPFDIGLMECGQYNDLWENVHMVPEQTVQAGLDVKASLIIPVHWGAFTLAPHSWKDPIERVTKETKRLNVPMITPRIGQTFTLGDTSFVATRWWEEVN